MGVSREWKVVQILQCLHIKNPSFFKIKKEKMVFEKLWEGARSNPFSSPISAQCESRLQGDEVVPGRNISAASAAEGDSCEFGSAKYYALCGFGGVLSCGITHTAVVPLDLVKCRIQVDKEKYKNLGNGFKLTLKEGGAKALALGWAPTFFGYSMQGLGKFGFYEAFKIMYSGMIGEENTYLYRTSLYLVSSASAEFFADIYKGITPLWGRQIPYTMMKFAYFERTVEALYANVVPKPRAECTKGEQLIVTFIAGYIAGVFCAIVSHPADTIVSKLNQDKTATVGGIAKSLGWAGMWSGLGPRIIMIGTLTALQWFIYDGVKVT